MFLSETRYWINKMLDETWFDPSGIEWTGSGCFRMESSCWSGWKNLKWKRSFIIFFNKRNYTLKKKLKLPAGGGKCLYELIHSNGWFIQEFSKRLSLWMGYWNIVSHDSKCGFIQKLLNTAVLLGDAQQFCYGFLGNIFVGKIEQKHTILCLKYSTIITSYLLKCCMKSHLHCVFFVTKTALVCYCSHCSCDIAYHKI